MRLSIVLLMLFAAFSDSYGKQPRGALSSVNVARTLGQPWPLPQSMQMTAQQYAIHPAVFHFLVNQSSQTCDLLTNALDRYYRITFFPQTYFNYIFHPESIDKQKESKLKANLNDLRDVPMVERLTIFIQQPCDQYPTLESNESCD